MKKYLSAAQIAKLKKPGRYAVGDGAYLQISQENTKAWIYRYQRNGRAHHMGLGPCSLVTLAEARSKARDAARQLLHNVDPISAKRSMKQQALLTAAKDKTFKECAEAYIAMRERGWRNPRSSEQWHHSLSAFVYPKIGDLSVAAIDMGLVLSVLEPIWSKVPETASRVRARLEAILDWARVHELRTGENPARWRGGLKSAGLPGRDEVQPVKHHAALRYAEIGPFMAELRGRREVSARLLEFAILTATRRGEACGARWSEIKGNVWEIPPDRMKARKEHRVPLCERALEILTSIPREGEYIFTGRGAGRVSGMAVLRLLARMGQGDLTMHGFRSTFRDWAAETTAYPNHVVEMALAHAIPDAVEAAYRRGDLMDKRRRLMEDWAKYCGRPALRSTGEVVTLRGAS